MVYTPAKGNETNSDLFELWKLHATIATSTYERLKNCLTFDPKYKFEYPRDAEEHFMELKRASTKISRFRTTHRAG